MTQTEYFKRVPQTLNIWFGKSVHAILTVYPHRMERLLWKCLGFWVSRRHMYFNGGRFNAVLTHTPFIQEFAERKICMVELALKAHQTAIH